MGGQILWLWYGARHFGREVRADYVLLLTQRQRPISSFGHWIFWDDTAPFSPAETRAVLAHGLAHVHQGHTAERLRLELVRTLLWFNPVVHLYPRALTQVHEFLADAAALQATGRPATPAAPTPYTALLARLALQGFQPELPLTHSFTQSFTLTRIRMLTSSSPIRRWKQWLLLPVATSLLGLLGAAQVAAQTLPAAPPAPNTPVYQSVDQMPVYPGGQDQFMQDLVAGITYPKSAKEAGVNTKVFIGFVVGADGRIYDITLKKGAQATDPAIAAELDAIALRAVKNLTQTWQPGRQDGKAVAVSYTLPVTFAP